MAKIESETRKAINEVYDSVIKDLLKIIEKIEEKEINEYKEKFEKDNDVIKAKELLQKIKNKYNSKYKHLDCYLGSIYYDDIEESVIHKQMSSLIHNIKNEKRTLLITLENFPKNSKEYKNSFKQFLEYSENKEKTKSRLNSLYGKVVSDND